jgi:hypothetical protein
VLLFLGLASLLGHLELVLAVVHDADHRRTSRWSYFDKIETEFFRLPERRIHVHYAELRTVGTDDADRTDADLAVDPHALGGVLDAVILVVKKKKRTLEMESAELRRTNSRGASTRHQQHATRLREGRRVELANANSLGELCLKRRTDRSLGQERVRLPVVCDTAPWNLGVVFEDDQPFLLSGPREDASFGLQRHQRFHVISHDPGQRQVR